MFSGAVHIKYKVHICIKGYISVNVKQYRRITIYIYMYMKLKCIDRVKYRWNTYSMHSHDMNIEDMDVRHHWNNTIS